ncbi:hypothetical protein EC08BKT55439_1366 [Escherichia coli 08BKT055439]|nr:hypothetical protein EC08BKT55439_1366 [Escherichia coli 08BKT055439]
MIAGHINRFQMAYPMAYPMAYCLEGKIKKRMLNNNMRL